MIINFNKIINNKLKFLKQLAPITWNVKENLLVDRENIIFYLLAKREVID